MQCANFPAPVGVLLGLGKSRLPQEALPLWPECLQVLKAVHASCDLSFAVLMLSAVGHDGTATMDRYGHCPAYMLLNEASRGCKTLEIDAIKCIAGLLPACIINCTAHS